MTNSLNSHSNVLDRFSHRSLSMSKAKQCCWPDRAFLRNLAHINGEKWSDLYENFITDVTLDHKVPVKFRKWYVSDCGIALAEAYALLVLLLLTIDAAAGCRCANIVDAEALTAWRRSWLTPALSTSAMTSSSPWRRAADGGDDAITWLRSSLDDVTRSLFIMSADDDDDDDVDSDDLSLKQVTATHRGFAHKEIP